jgi:hypothetical protein
MCHEGRFSVDGTQPYLTAEHPLVVLKFERARFALTGVRKLRCLLVDVSLVHEQDRRVLNVRFHEEGAFADRNVVVVEDRHVGDEPDEQDREGVHNASCVTDNVNSCTRCRGRLART